MNAVSVSQGQYAIYFSSVCPMDLILYNHIKDTDKLQCDEGNMLQGICIFLQRKAIDFRNYFILNINHSFLIPKLQYPLSHANTNSSRSTLCALKRMYSPFTNVMHSKALQKFKWQVNFSLSAHFTLILSHYIEQICTLWACYTTRNY